MTYPIKRQKDGIYIYIDFNSNNKVPEALKTLFHVSDFVLRHMTVLREDAPVIPAVSVVTDAPATEAISADAGSSSAAVATPSVAQSAESPSTK